MKKGDKLIELITFFIVKFILQNGEISGFSQFDFAFVLFPPASQNG